MTDNEYIDIRLKAQKLEKNRKGYLNYLCSTFDCDKSTARAIFEKLVNNEPLEVKPMEEDAVEIKQEGLLFGDGYVYNSATDKYIVKLRSYGVNYICPGDQHRAMLTAYSNWAGNERSIQKIATDYKMRREWVIEYFRIFNWTHDAVPITDEEIKLGKFQEAQERVIDRKKTDYLQELQKADWKQIQSDARNWQLFEFGQLEPFERLLHKWTPPIIPAIAQPKLKQLKKNVFVTTLSDLHIGLRSDSTELTKGGNYNSDVVSEVIDNYSKKIAIDVADRNYSFEKCVLISAGDILHSLSGETEKGTQLECDILGESQFELALNCLHRFITRMLEIFGTVEVHSTKGNHSSADWILFKTLECAFNANKRITFNNYKTRTSIFRIKNIAIILDHGESDYVKAKVPTGVLGRESYVQNKFLELGERVGPGIKARIFLQGDKHHYEQSEFRGFEFIMLSTCVLGDKYSDHLGLHSRPRQNCFIFEDNGIKEVLHYYLD